MRSFIKPKLDYNKVLTRNTITPTEHRFEALEKAPSKDHYDKNELVHIKKIHGAVAHFGFIKKNNGVPYQFLMTSQSKPPVEAKIIDHSKSDKLMTIEMAKAAAMNVHYKISQNTANRLKQLGYDIKPGFYKTEELIEHQKLFDDHMSCRSLPKEPLFTQY